MSLGGIGNLDHTVLLCRRLTETRGFYRDVMRFAMLKDSPRWVEFQVGAARLTLRPRDGWPIETTGGPEPGAASVQLAFRVAPPAIESCFAELTALGVPILRAPTDLPDWRHRTRFFRDPEGNVLEIYAEY